tara:strand:+ start:93 stop:542 length:450 start_codon:yes stop_codon:yes gene_type:complete
MIIECINCNKSFQVDSSLIPSEGRTIQCGSCNHVWFFQKQKEISKIKNLKEIKIEKDSNLDDKIVSNKKTKTRSKSKTYEITKYKAKSNFTFVSFLSLLVVLIISFIALIIILDTFKSELYKIFPNLEFFLFSFYEILKDIELFIRDLI